MGNGVIGMGRELKFDSPKDKTPSPHTPEQHGRKKPSMMKRALSIFSILAESAIIVSVSSSCGGSVEAEPQTTKTNPDHKDSGKDAKEEESESKDARDDLSEASSDALEDALDKDAPDDKDAAWDSIDSHDALSDQMPDVDAADSGSDAKDDHDSGFLDSNADPPDSIPDSFDSAMPDAPLDTISDTSQDPDTAMPDSLDAAPDSADSSVEAGNICYEPFVTSFYNWMGFGTDYNIANIFVKTTGIAPEEMVDGGMLGKGVYVDIYRSCSITNIPLAQHLHVIEFKPSFVSVSGTVYTLSIINYDHSSNSALNMVDIAK